MLPTMTANYTENLKEACLQLAPEDELERAIDLDERQKAILLGRKLHCVDAALAVVSTLAAALDDDDEEQPHRAAAEAQLAEVLAWRQSPSAEGEARVQDALERSSLVSRVRTPHGDAVRPAYETQLGRAVYYTVRAALADKPSDAASCLRTAAFAVVNHLGWLNDKCPVDYHSLLAARVTSAGAPE